MDFLRWLKSLSDRPPSEDDWQVTFDDNGVTCKRSTGLVESVSWNDLQKVSIVTTDDGPFAEDVFYVLYSADAGCVVPQGAPNSSDLLERLQELSGFDSEAVVQAMGCASNNEFVCWEREATPNT